MKVGDLVAFEFEDIYLALITKAYDDGAVDAFFSGHGILYYSNEELVDCSYEIIGE
jgi:hypothetical protein